MTAPLPDLAEAIDAAAAALHSMYDIEAPFENPIKCGTCRYEAEVAAEKLVPQVQAAERERIAQAIECAPIASPDWLTTQTAAAVMREAARIARSEP